MKDHYIQAVIALLHAGKEPKAVFAGLQTVLAHHNHSRLLSKIMQGVVRHTGAARGIDTAVITVADEAGYTEQQPEITAALAEVGVTEEPIVAYDPRTIGGFKIATANLTLDRTYKSKLTELYRAITA